MQPSILHDFILPTLKYALENLPGFLYHISPALVGVFWGSLLIQKYFVAHSNEAAFIDLLVRELDVLRSDALEYWNPSGDPAEYKRHQQVLAQKIKGSIKSLNSDINYYCARYCKCKQEHLSTLLTDLSDACTGGEFESTKKAPDPGRYLIIVNAVNRIRSELFQRKI